MTATKAWDCFPSDGDPYRLVVFADTRNQACYLAHREDPGDTGFLHMRARRFPVADGLAPSGTVWIGPGDLPPDLRHRAGDFWDLERDE
jgi:hypothetical protein